ncbi:ras GTPase-activating protein 1-like isoform X4 [Plutella xylostella]|uniref:ras GTPase-activating protein 1-like isoform X4 n=1 Tax=Plutella xylostella TaxID=51655 RepID=UPI002032FBF2|nr:ras GTPase-activating protein 1-like isoform X4 [Plutella xylostella]
MVQISSSMRSYAIFPRPRWFYKAMPRLPSMPSHDDAAGGAAAAGWPASNGAAVSAPAATAPFTTQISVPVCSGAGTGAAPPVAAAAICGAAAGAVCAVADHGGGAAVRRGLFVESPRWWQGPLVAWSGRGGRHGRGAGRGGARSQSWAQSRPRHLWSISVPVCSGGTGAYPPWPPPPCAVPLPAPYAPWPTTEVAPPFAAACS